MTATYDSQKVGALGLAQDQSGYNVTTSWTESVPPITSTAARALGFSFDFAVTNESEQGLFLAPRLPFTAGTDPAWTLTIGTLHSTIPTVTIHLYGVRTATPVVWSDSNLPFTNIATEGATYLIDTFDENSSAWVLNGSVYDLVWDFDFLTNYTDPVTGAAVTSPMAVAVNNSRWNGIMQFILKRDFGGGLSVFSSYAFAGNVHNWHTGMIGAQMDRRARAVHDQITGQPYMSDRAVADGYRDGVMVHPDNYDPVDPLDENPWTPPPGEGVVDDEIVDVE